MGFRRKIEEKKPEYIGEYCARWFNSEGHQWKEWTKFTKEDVQDEIDGYIKIKDVWKEKDFIFYYGDVDIYAPLRKKIEKKFDKEK